jgi:hypothetical protein
VEFELRERKINSLLIQNCINVKKMIVRNINIFDIVVVDPKDCFGKLNQSHLANEKLEINL